MRRLLLVMLLILLTAVPALAQSPLDECLGDYITQVPAVVGPITPNYTLNVWEYDGQPIVLEWNWDEAIRVDFHDGGPRVDAMLLTAETSVGPAMGLFLRPTDGTYNWHGRCLYLVEGDPLDRMAEQPK